MEDSGTESLDMEQGFACGSTSLLFQATGTWGLSVTAA